MNNIKTEVILSKGVGKTSGKEYFSLKFKYGKYLSEPLFISELEYEYLENITNPIYSDSTDFLKD